MIKCTVNSFHPLPSLRGGRHYYAHFTDEEMEAQRGQNNLPNLGCSGQTVTLGSEPRPSLISQCFSTLDGKAA